MSGRADRDALSGWDGRSFWRCLFGSAEGAIGISMLAVVLLVILVGPFVAPYGSNEIGTGLSLAGPSSEHILGTDQLGRDVFSRYLQGGATVVLIPFVGNLLGFLAGGLLGLAGAYYGGRFDAVLTRCVDLLIALPALLLTLILIAGMGSSGRTLVATIALVTLPQACRVVRGAAKPIALQDYVLVARLRGERAWRILCSEILPNVAGSVAAIFSLYLTYAIIAVSTLNFLGLGAQPPSSDWGLMIAESREFLRINMWATLVPVASIAALAVGCTLLSDAVSRHVANDDGES